jgi:hypothetical protein
VEALEDRHVPATISWTGADDGVSWGDPQNWSGIPIPGMPGAFFYQVPGPNDTAVVANSPGPVIVASAGVNVGALQYTAPGIALVFNMGGAVGDLTVNAPGSQFIMNNANFGVNGTFTWHTGELTGTRGGMTLSGTTNIDGGTNTLTIDTVGVTNAGTANWMSANINLTGGATITNAAVGTFDAQSDFALSGGATEKFNNQGLFKKSASGLGPGTVIECTFNNQAPLGGGSVAQVESDAGFLQFLGGGTHTGTFTANGGEIDFVQGVQTLLNGARFAGRWVKVFSQATLTVPAGNTAVNLGSLYLAPGCDLDGSGIGGGDGQFNNDNVIWWAGDTIDTLLFNNDPGSDLEILVGGTKYLDSSVLTNLGYINWTSGNIEMDTNSGPCYVLNYAVFNVQASAQIVDGRIGIRVTEIINATQVGGATGGTFTIGGGAVATINPRFDNEAGATLNEGGGSLSVPNLVLPSNGTVIP